MKILCISDVHSRTKNIDKIRDLEFDLIVISGDITNFGGYEEALLIIERFNKAFGNMRILAVPGNCDYPEVDKALADLKMNLNGSCIVVGDVGFFGVGGSNSTPFNTPLEFSDEHLYKKAVEGYECAKNAKFKILISHAPPFGTKVDRTSSGLNVGSKKIREFIENNDIDIVICGHIHEAKGSDKIGKTLIINPGPFAHGCCLLEINNEIKYRFITF